MATSLTQTDTYAIKQEIAHLEAQLVAAQPVEPFEVGSVIRFHKYDGNYMFAAIKVREAVVTMSGVGIVTEGVWYITQDGSRSSKQGHAPKAWTELLTWIGERNWHRIEVLG